MKRYVSMTRHMKKHYENLGWITWVFFHIVHPLLPGLKFVCRYHYQLEAFVDKLHGQTYNISSIMNNVSTSITATAISYYTLMAFPYPTLQAVSNSFLSHDESIFFQNNQHQIC